MNGVIELNEKKVSGKKRGRKSKNEKVVYELNRDQTKFFVDLSKERVPLEKVFDLLIKTNKKDYGREITFKDLALFGIDKIVDKDIDKIKDGSLSEMEKVKKALDEYNLKNKTSLSMGEFLVKKLSIN
ncbi:MAG: hypothetical protein K9K67_15665 [Bacteriovoracaceae bacterium]|nr:hypothetical protein [Bacteriovoracaceae bacterium]